jgi:hypothetical protein
MWNAEPSPFAGLPLLSFYHFLIAIICTYRHLTGYNVTCERERRSAMVDILAEVTRSEKAALKDFARPQVINDHGMPVGEIRPVVSLNMAR